MPSLGIKQTILAYHAVLELNAVVGQNRSKETPPLQLGQVYVYDSKVGGSFSAKLFSNISAEI